MRSEEFAKLYVKDGKILPNEVDTIEGDLNLYSDKISIIENLPNTIKGDLNLSYNQITKIENLPNNIEKGLYLSGNPIYKEIKSFKGEDTKEKTYNYFRNFRTTTNMENWI